MQWLTAERANKAGRFGSAEKETLKLLDTADWHLDARAAKVLRPLLNDALLIYLIEAKDRQGKPLESVSRFHLGNGARLDRVNWLGDISEKGMREAAGFMVNYLYDLDRIERNHESYANQGEIVLGTKLRRQYEKMQGKNSVAR